jgi:GNAT superfamily N-acetyltransferase
MEQIPPGRSDAAEIQAVYDNLYGYYDFLGQSSQAFYHRGADRTRLTTRLQISFFNVLYRMELPPETEAETIQDVIDLFAAGGVQEYTWWIGPGDPAPAAAARLRSAGFVRGELPGMYLDIDSLPDSPPLPDGITLQPVRTKAQLMEWAQVCMKGFGGSGEGSQDLYDLLVEQGFNASARYYTALWQGAPAACSMLLVTGSVAGIYSVTTLAEARNQGLGGAATRAALNDARSLGCTAATLQASRMGFPLYQKLGFRKVCDLGEYQFQKP